MQSHTFSLLYWGSKAKAKQLYTTQQLRRTALGGIRTNNTPTLYRHELLPRGSQIYNTIQTSTTVQTDEWVRRLCQTKQHTQDSLIKSKLYLLELQLDTWHLLITSHCNISLTSSSNQLHNSISHYHESQHDGQSIVNLIGRLYQNDCETDRHSDHAP